MKSERRLHDSNSGVNAIRVNETPSEDSERTKEINYAQAHERRRTHRKHVVFISYEYAVQLKVRLRRMTTVTSVVAIGVEVPDLKTRYEDLSRMATTNAGKVR